MVLKMKNFTLYNIFGVHGKNPSFRGGGGMGVHEKPICRRDCLKRRGFAWFADLGGGTWQERERWCF